MSISSEARQIFSHYIKPRSGIVANRSTSKHPYFLSSWGLEGNIKHSKFSSQDSVGSYGVVYETGGVLSFNQGSLQGYQFPLVSGMWFTAQEEFTIHGGSGMVIEAKDPLNRPPFALGGPIEDFGRLKYIDGCSDSLLAGPPVIGDPCLNFLHFPENTSQTRHTHPSCRVGIVIRGKGVCVVSSFDDSNLNKEEEEEADSILEEEISEILLEPGTMFEIPAGLPHSFDTRFDGSCLDVIAWHPDSDTGPSHLDHPMINRTIVGGKKASEIENLITTSISK